MSSNSPMHILTTQAEVDGLMQYNEHMHQFTYIYVEISTANLLMLHTSCMTPAEQRLATIKQKQAPTHMARLGSFKLHCLLQASLRHCQLSCRHPQLHRG